MTSPLPEGTARSGTPEASVGSPPGRRAIFSLDGRATPGLYLFGWLASGFGLALFVVVVASATGGLAGLGLTLAATVLLSLGLVAAAGAQGAQRRADGAVAYGGPSPFLVFAASLPVTVLLVIVLVGGASLVGLEARSPQAALIQVLLTALVSVGLVALLVVDPGALRWSDMGLRRMPLGRLVVDVLWGASFALPVIFVTSIIAAVLVQALGTTPDSPLPPSGSREGFLLNMVSGALVAPIGEEIFYRGFALTAWARGLDRRVAIVRSAIFFAFVHVLTVGGASFAEGASQALIAFAVRLPVALALGWVFLRRGSLPAAIGLHAAFNGILLLVAEAASGTSG